MTQYTKFIVAIIMAIYNIVHQATGLNLPGFDDTTMTVIVNTVLGLLVYALPNKGASTSTGSTLRSPAIATSVAFAGALAVILFLSGCASLSVGSGASIDQRVTAAKTDLATAGLFVAVYAALPECGPAVQQPCHNASVLGLLQKGQVLAKSALDAVDALIAAGSPEEKILVALQEAEKAVVTLQNLKANAGG